MEFVRLGRKVLSVLARLGAVAGDLAPLLASLGGLVQIDAPAIGAALVEIPPVIVLGGAESLADPQAVAWLRLRERA